MSPRDAARARKPRAPARIDERACPEGKRRGIDVARMFGEIEKLTRSYAAKHAPDLDIEDLVQEVALNIGAKNASEKSAFDPTRSSFGHYVTLVARSKAGHLRAKRYHTGEVSTEDDALEALHDSRAHDGLATKRDTADRRTVGELVELIREAEQTAVTQARALRARDALAAARADGIAEASRKYSALLDGAFEPDAELPPARSKAPPSRALPAKPPPPDPLAGVRRKLKAALASWQSAVALEDARIRETLAKAFARMRSPKRAALARSGAKQYAQQLVGERSPHVKRHVAIAAAIAADPHASDREIGRRVGCDHKTAAAVRSAYFRGTSKSAAVAAAARSARRS